ncbi:MAG: NADP-dependent glyceraldehyde-3-phosphate dehydrogenase [Luteibaculaceae bacterium]
MPENNATLFPMENEIPASFQLAEEIHQKTYLINGEIRTWSGATNEIFSPVYIKDKDNQLKQKRIGSSPLLTSKEALEALQAAEEAYDHGLGQWPSMALPKRIEHVEHFVEKMILQRDAVVKLLMWEIGKNLKDSQKEFDRTVDYINDTIVQLKKNDRDSTKFEMESGIIAQIRRVPFGIALCMGPYNYPLNETFTTLIPALIMGNTVIFKPAKYGVLLIKPLLEAFRDCFPPGVINIIYGRGRDTAGEIMKTGKLNLFVFIGSNKGANDLKKMHPKPHMLRSVLGLDAKNPAVVLPCANLDTAVSECVVGSLSFNGQRCTALKIIWVHKTLINSFLEKFSDKVNELVLGMPWEENVSITPLPEPEKTDYLSSLIEDAVIHGGKVVNDGGGKVEYSLFYPAVVYPVNEKMKLWREEQFGPVVPVVAYDDIEEVKAYIVNSNFGQQASIFGQNPIHIANMVDSLVNQVSRININTQCQRGPDNFPFNGRKDSAEGTLSVNDALKVFSIRTMVATKENAENKEIINQIITNRSSSFLSRDYIF